jgi:hypothetical protein
MKYHSGTAVGTLEPSHFSPIKTLATILCVVAFSHSGRTQVAPSIILQVDVENFVVYTYDISDSSKFATDQNRTISSLGLQAGGLRTFTPFIGIADIVTVNGTPAKGTWLTRGIVLNLQTNPLPGQAIADTIRTNITDQVFEIQQANGTPIGTIMASEVGSRSTMSRAAITC